MSDSGSSRRMWRASVVGCAMCVAVGTVVAGPAHAASPHAYAYAGPAMPIPDNDPTGISSVINVPDGLGMARGVTVKIGELDHTWVGDLVLYLRNPSGVEVMLHNTDANLSGNNYLNTEFSDDAVKNIDNYNAPFTGTFKPAQPLGILGGQQSVGAWTLRVIDEAQSDVGTLVAWSITVTADSAAVPVPPTPVTAVQLAGCVTAPKSLPRKGTRNLTWPACRTSAGQLVVATAAGGKGYRIVRLANGRYQFKASRVKGTVRITWSAPATAGYSAYRLVRSYRK
ncbi:MAG: proprotein convertase P-domain-containing protein [Actinomycetes bacterium]